MTILFRIFRILRMPKLFLNLKIIKYAKNLLLIISLNTKMQNKGEMTMLLHEFESLKKVKQDKPTIITIEDLINRDDRTLLYGFTFNKDTWHVYLKNNEIYTVVYEFNGRPQPIEVRTNEDYIPDKRLYPERCDFEFCNLLKQKGFELPFYQWKDNVDFKIYYGEIV